MQRRRAVSTRNNPPLSIPSARPQHFQNSRSHGGQTLWTFHLRRRLLVQRHSDNEVILKLADCRLCYCSKKDSLDTVPWTPSIDEHLRRAVHDIRARAIPDWFEDITDLDDRPDTELWEDWMWEVSTWFRKIGSYDTELAAYQLLHRLQGQYIPCLLGVVHLGITPEFTPSSHHRHCPRTSFECILGVSMEKLKPGIDVWPRGFPVM